MVPWFLNRRTHCWILLNWLFGLVERTHLNLMSFNSTDAKGHLGKKRWITTFMPFQFASRFLQQRTYQKWDPLDGTRFGPARESRPEAINDGALDWEPSILTGKSRCIEMAEIISTSWCFSYKSSTPRQRWEKHLFLMVQQERDEWLHQTQLAFEISPAMHKRSCFACTLHH